MNTPFALYLAGILGLAYVLAAILGLRAYPKDRRGLGLALIALGGAGLFGNLVIDSHQVLLPVILLLTISVMLLVFSYRHKAITARWGFVFIGFYLCFLSLESLLNTV